MLEKQLQKKSVDKLFIDPGLLKNTTHIDLKDRNTTNARFIQMAQIDAHLTATLFVDNAIYETSLVKNDQDNIFNNDNLFNINSFTLSTQAANDKQNMSKACVDQFHNENK